MRLQVQISPAAVFLWGRLTRNS